MKSEFYYLKCNLTRPPTKEQLRATTTDELAVMLMSSEIAEPMNESLRQTIIQILQQREGNAFVQRLLGQSSGPKNG